MKKLLCFTLSLLMLLALHIPAVATETGDPVTSSANLNDSLVSWWNFEGDEATAVLDKATKGKHENDLATNNTSTQITFDKATGTVTVPATKSECLKVEATEDLVNPTSMTVYLKAKYTGNNTDFADLIAINNLYRIYKLKDATSENGAVFEAAAFYTTGSNRVRPQTSASVKIEPDQWFYLALTMKINEEKTATAALYISTDGVNYVKNETYATTTSLTLTEDAIKTLEGYTSNTAYIGKKDGSQDAGIGYTFDDIRIYNKALTEAEIESINRPTCVGYQVKDDTATDGSYSLRFLATVNSLDFTEVGFEITAAYGGNGNKQFTKSCEYVYRSVNAANGSVSAESQGGNYLVALALTGIPDNVGEVTYTVKPFAKKGVDSDPIYGATVTFSHNIAS